MLITIELQFFLLRNNSSNFYAKLIELKIK